MWNFKINFETFESRNFRIIKSTPSRNHPNQYFRKNFEENLIKFYKKFEEQSEKFS